MDSGHIDGDASPGPDGGLLDLPRKLVPLALWEMNDQYGGQVDGARALDVQDIKEESTTARGLGDGVLGNMLDAFCRLKGVWYGFMGLKQRDG